MLGNRYESGCVSFQMQTTFKFLLFCLTSERAFGGHPPLDRETRILNSALSMTSNRILSNLPKRAVLRWHKTCLFRTFIWNKFRCSECLMRYRKIFPPPLWSSGQSFWLQIQRSRVRFLADSRFSEKQRVWNGVNSASWGQLRLRWPRGTLYPKKLTLTPPTSGGRSVGIVHSRTSATEFSLVLVSVISSISIHFVSARHEHQGKESVQKSQRTKWENPLL
jgi:hypothetical protein